MGSTLLSADAEGLSAWDLDTSARVALLEGCRALAFDGQRLLTARDGQLHLTRPEAPSS